MDTEIDREEVAKAVSKTRQSQTHGQVLQHGNNHEEIPKNSLLCLPAEIRNYIFELVLNIGGDTASNIRIPCPKKSNQSLSEGMSLLRSCKQITYEPRSILESRTTAYLPVMANMNFRELVSYIKKESHASVPSVSSTIFAALSSFMHAHIHLHISHQPSRHP
jgi:hypothetical protein